MQDPITNVGDRHPQGGVLQIQTTDRRPNPLNRLLGWIVRRHVNPLPVLWDPLHIGNDDRKLAVFDHLEDGRQVCARIGHNDRVLSRQFIAEGIELDHLTCDLPCRTHHENLRVEKKRKDQATIQSKLRYPDLRHQTQKT